MLSVSSERDSFISMALARFDLNLLKTLDAIERTRSLQSAGARLHVTPSAVSHALRRLRRDLGDPLFVRAGHELAPTRRCRSVLSRVRPFLAAFDAELHASASPAAEAFDPAADRRAVAAAMPGAVELTLLPALTERLFRRAPGWTLTVGGFQRRSYEADLLSGDVDVVLSVGGHTPRSEGLSVGELWRDEIVALQGPAGPLPDDAPATLDHVIGLPQVYPAPWPREQNYIDVKLAREGRRRAIVLSIPGYASLGETLSRTALLAMLPDRAALAILRRHPELRLIRIAPALRMSLSLETTERFEGSPAGRWFLSELRAAAAEVQTVTAPERSTPFP